MAKSIEPEVKDWFAQALSQHKTKYCIEQGTLNIEIENALKAAPSKSGGNGYGRPDFQLMLSFCRRGSQAIKIIINTCQLVRFAYNQG